MDLVRHGVAPQREPSPASEHVIPTLLLNAGCVLLEVHATEIVLGAVTVSLEWPKFAPKGEFGVRAKPTIRTGNAHAHREDLDPRSVIARLDSVFYHKYACAAILRRPNR
jgi:hypothetical protein